MTTFPPNSPRLQHGSIIAIDQVSKQQTEIKFQYNPDTMTRRLTAQTASGNYDRSEAFRLKGLSDFELVAVGGEPARDGDAFRCLGALPDGELRCAYTGAAALVFPSLWEGFGLPLVEAMSCGTPIAASDIPTNREIAGEASVRFDPADALGCAEAILEAARSGRERLVAAGRQRVKRFSWERCAEATRRVYGEVMGG